MQAEQQPQSPQPQIRPSFFDDEDPSAGFDFQSAPTRSAQKDLNLPCRIKGTLLRQFPNSPAIDEGYYVLQNKTLARYKSSTSKILVNVLEIGLSKIKLLVPTDTNPHFGFSLNKNGVTHEFYHPGKPIIEDWFESLKDVCVMSTFHEEYKAHKMIGKGSFAKVYLVESTTNGKKYAVKAFTKESLIHANKNNAKPSMLNEIDIMRSLDHENIIKLYEVYETEKSIYLVLELIQGKSLQEILKKPTFKEEYSDIKIVNMIRSILDALAYLAAKGIMHRDLKPDNILLDKEGKIKIADFGLATFIDIPEYIFKKCGTPGYIAPEVFKYDHNNPLTDYDHRCDVFSAGCIFFYMLFRVPFFDGTNASEILRLNRKFTYEFNAIFTIQKELMSPSSKMSKDGLKLLLRLLEFEPKNRFSAEESLCQPFFIPVPTGMQKAFGTNDLITDPHAIYSHDSPTWMKGSNPNSPKLSDNFALSKQGSFKNFTNFQQQSNNKDRFMEKDSLYLDVGKMELNGRTDTINTGLSNNNSLLLQKKNSNASIGSNSGSASGFGKLSPDKKSKSFRGPSGNHNNHDFLKAAIIRNMQRNNTNEFQNGEPFIMANGDQTQSAGLPGGISAFSPYKHHRSESQGSGQGQQDNLSETPSEEEQEQNGKDMSMSPNKEMGSPKRKFHPFATQNNEKVVQ